MNSWASNTVISNLAIYPRMESRIFYRFSCIPDDACEKVPWDHGNQMKLSTLGHIGTHLFTILHNHPYIHGFVTPLIVASTAALLRDCFLKSLLLQCDQMAHVWRIYPIILGSNLSFSGRHAASKFASALACRPLNLLEEIKNFYRLYRYDPTLTVTLIYMYIVPGLQKLTLITLYEKVYLHCNSNFTSVRGDLWA